MSPAFDELLPAGTVPIAAELRRELQTMPWMYPWPLRDGTVAPIYSDELHAVHRTRREMIEPAVRATLAGAGPDARVLDLGCNEGLFAHLARAWGARHVVGCDIRERNVRRAVAIRDHYGIPAAELEFRHADVHALDPAELGTFDVVLCLGLVYHLEDPVGALRLARRLLAPGGLCVAESQLTRQAQPIVYGWGTSSCLDETEASFAVRFENAPDHPLASPDGTLSLIPNAAALELAMRVAGFARVLWLEAGPDHNPQYVRRDRGILTGRALERNGAPMIEILGTVGPDAVRDALWSDDAPGAEVERLRAELARTQAWLGSIQRSASWRLTAPLRAAKRALRRRPS